ncbi:hypothetical protein P691DRAFT_683937, partial [Macrolepiota fuliginosa MF-IS2]
IPPDKYDGSADAQTFFHFVQQSLDYLEDSRAPPNCEVLILSHFLTGKAYDFYVLEVSMEPAHWQKDQFLEKLFDYCFPPNFKSQQCCHLEHFRQGELSVHEYLYKLCEYFTILGWNQMQNHREMVNKLWFGLK